MTIMFEIILTFSCADQPGIVAAVASHFAERGFNIKESSQFEDEQSGQFFMRTKLGAPATGKVEGSQLEAIKAAFAPIASQYQMDWQIHDANQPMKVVIAVSKWGHCLNKLLNNYKRGSLPIEVVAVVSNHPDMAEVCEWYQVPYHHLAVNNQNREQQEQQILEIMQQTDAELLVLAGVESSPAAAESRFDRLLASGQALERFEQMIQAQGGDLNQRRPLAPATEIRSPESGWVTEMNTRALSEAVISVGGGRHVMTDVIDPSVGLEMMVRIGDRVEQGARLARLYAHPGPQCALAESQIAQSIHIGEQPVECPSLIIDRRGA